MRKMRRRKRSTISKRQVRIQNEERKTGMTIEIDDEKVGIQGEETEKRRWRR